MSKPEQAEEQRELTAQEKAERAEKAAKAIVGMRRDLVGVRNKVMGEFLLLTKESGAVDITSERFKAMYSSLMAINQEANQLSLQATEEGMLKRLGKLEKDVDLAASQQFRDDITTLRTDLTTTLSSKENLENGLVNYCKMRTLQTSPFQVILTKDTPMRKAGESRPMDQEEISELYGILQPALSAIDIPATSLSDIAAMGSGVIDQRISPITRKRMTEFFGDKTQDVKGQDVVVLDRAKLTPENIKAFGIAVNEDLTKELSKMKAEHLIQDAIEQMKSRYGVTYTPEIAERIKAGLVSDVTVLGPEFIEANKEILTQSLSSSLRNGQSYFSRAMGDYPTSDLEKVARQFNKEYQPKADSYQQQKIEGSVLKLRMGNPLLAAKLTELGVEKAKATRYDITQLSDADLVKVRQENPELFDKVVLKRDEVAPSTIAVIDGIIVQAVNKLQQGGVKLSQEKIDHLKKQMEDHLTPALSKFDSKFLYEQREDISSKIQKELYKNRSFGYALGAQFSVTDNSLAKMSKGIIAHCQKSYDEFELQTVREGRTSVVSNAELEQRLNELAVEKAKAVKFNPNNLAELSADVLLKMRKENPTLFDKVVLGKEGAVKPAVADPLKARAQGVAPKEPSPAVSEHNSPQSSPKKVVVATAQEQADAKSNIPVAPQLPTNYSPSPSKSYIAQDALAEAFKEQQGTRRPAPSPLPGNRPVPPSSDLSQDGKPVVVKRPPPPPPRSRLVPPLSDRGQDGQEPVAVKRSPPPLPGNRPPPPPPRSRLVPPSSDLSQDGKPVAVKRSPPPLPGNRPPPPLPGNRSQNAQKVSDDSPQKQQGAALHPSPTPRLAHPRSRSSNNEGQGHGI